MSVTRPWHVCIAIRSEYRTTITSLRTPLGVGGAFAPMVGLLITTKLFGVKHYGAVSGAIQAIGFSGQMVALILGALLFDFRADYYFSFMIYCISLR